MVIPVVESDAKEAMAMVDPEVPERAKARRYTAAYKLRIVQEYESLGKAGKGSLLRREGLYSSLVCAWRRQRDRGAIVALAQSVGRPEANPRERELAQLRKEKAHLEHELEKARRVIFPANGGPEPVFPSWSACVLATFVGPSSDADHLDARDGVNAASAPKVTTPAQPPPASVAAPPAEGSGEGTWTRTLVIGVMNASPSWARRGEMSTGIAARGQLARNAFTTSSWTCAGATGVRWIMHSNSPFRPGMDQVTSAGVTAETMPGRGGVSRRGRTSATRRSISARRSGSGRSKSTLSARVRDARSSSQSRISSSTRARSATVSGQSVTVDAGTWCRDRVRPSASLQRAIGSPRWLLVRTMAPWPD